MESVASESNQLQDAIPEAHSTVRTSLAQNRFAIRMNEGDNDVSMSRLAEAVDVSNASNCKDSEVPVSFAQKRFAIRMHDEGDATLHMAADTEASGVAVSTHHIDVARKPLVQKRFAIRMHEEEHSVCLGSLGQSSQCPVASTSSCGTHRFPAPCTQQERKVTSDMELIPWPQKCFQICVQHAGLADKGYQMREAPQPRQQQDQKAAPTSFSQQRFAIRMHSELGTASFVAPAVLPAAIKDVAPAPPSFTWRYMATQMHECQV